MSIRIPLATSLKTRTGAPDKDARLTNAYVEEKGDQSVVRKRPIVQGGVSIGTGTAQGGIGFNIAGTDYFIGFWADTMQTYTGGGTSWNSGTSYSIGDHVAVEFVDYWAVTDNTNSSPPSSDWSRSFVSPVPHVYATWNPLDDGNMTLSNGNLTAVGSNTFARSTISKSSGKWYWEYTITNFLVTTATPTLGVAKSTANNSLYLGWDANGWAHVMSYYYFGNPYDPNGIGLTLNNSTYAIYGTPYVTNSVMGVALDMDAGTLTFYLNGVSQGVAYSGLSGNIFAAVGNTSGASPTYTANFGASAFAHSVPSGYNSGLYT